MKSEADLEDSLPGPCMLEKMVDSTWNWEHVVSAVSLGGKYHPVT